MSIRILHCADLHLDSPFDSLPENKAAIMRNEQRALLLFIADIANQRKADIVLMAGDLLDSTVAYYETTDALKEALSRINAKVFISPGNHDFFCSTSPYFFTDFPENVHIFKNQSVECIELPELNCRVYGAAFVSSASSSLLNTFTAEDDNAVNIMCIHGNLMGDSYNRITTANIAASNLDYLALGHIHARSEVAQAGNTYFAYPGCPQGRGFDELGDKGIYFGEVSKGSVNLEFIPTCRRRYFETEIDVSSFENTLSAAEAALSGIDSRDIVRVVLTGETDEEIDTTAISEKLSSKAFHLVVRNKTQHRRDLWEGLSEDTLRGSFLRIMRRKFESAADDDERNIVIAALKYALAAMDNREGC